MAIEVINYVVEHSPVKHGQRLVLLVLAWHAHRDGSHARPSVATIMRETRLSRGGVQSALIGLLASGAIEAVGMTPRGVTIYRVVMLPNAGRGGPDSGPVDVAESGPQRSRFKTGGALNLGGGGLKSGPEPSENRPGTGLEPPSAPSRTPAREGGGWASFLDTKGSSPRQQARLRRTQRRLAPDHDPHQEPSP